MCRFSGLSWPYLVLPFPFSCFFYVLSLSLLEPSRPFLCLFSVSFSVISRHPFSVPFLPFICTFSVLFTFSPSFFPLCSVLSPLYSPFSTLAVPSLPVLLSFLIDICPSFLCPFLVPSLTLSLSFPYPFSVLPLSFLCPVSVISLSFLCAFSVLSGSSLYPLSFLSLSFSHPSCPFSCPSHPSVVCPKLVEGILKDIATRREPSHALETGKFVLKPEVFTAEYDSTFFHQSLQASEREALASRRYCWE